MTSRLEFEPATNGLEVKRFTSNDLFSLLNIFYSSQYLLKIA